MLALSAARRLLRPAGDLLPPSGLACLWAAGARRCCAAGAGPPNPVVYLDVGADNQPLGRVVLEVGARGLPAAPLAAGPGGGCPRSRGRRGARARRSVSGKVRAGPGTGRDGTRVARPPAPAPGAAPVVGVRGARGMAALAGLPEPLPGRPRGSARWARGR